MATRFLYRANWVRLVTAETIILNLDLGFYTFRTGTFRLKNVAAADTPQAREALEHLLLTAGDLRVETHKSSLDDEWFATILHTDASGSEVNLNEAYVALNVARVLSST